VDLRWLRWLASAGGALATRRNLAGIRQFSATVAGGWLSVKEPAAGTGLGMAGKRQVASGQVADICPSHTQPGPSQHFGDPATFQRSASRIFQLGIAANQLAMAGKQFAMGEEQLEIGAKNSNEC